jgi:hypothetical protein
MSGGTSVDTPYAPTGTARGGTGTGYEVLARKPGKANVRLPVPPPYNQDTSMARDWPLRSFLELGALPSAVPCARLHTRAVLWEWGLRPGEQAELVVSEIITNAVQASRSLGHIATVRLWLFSDKEAFNPGLGRQPRPPSTIPIR